MISIEIRGISKSFGNKEPLFQDVNLSLEKGDFAFLTGKSGSGKSTFLKIIHHIENADSGSIILDSDNKKKMSVAVLRRNIGFILWKLILKW